MKISISCLAVSLAAALSPALAQAQSLFVSDSFSNIDEFTPGGTQSTFASGLNNPSGLAFDHAGNLYSADHSGNIYEFTPGGTRSAFASGLNNPSGLAFDRAGSLFVTSVGWGIVYEFTPGGTQSTFATFSLLSGPVGLAFDSAGNLFVSCFAAATSMNSRRAERKAPSPPG